MAQEHFAILHHASAAKRIFIIILYPNNNVISLSLTIRVVLWYVDSTKLDPRNWKFVVYRTVQYIL